MTRDKDSLVEMLAKIPITETRGSLLSSIGKLLRVIDISENSIMIPTLLKDRYEFDANEMLVLAKILKASILGHNDLVEFYISESSSQATAISPIHSHLKQNLRQQNSTTASNQSNQSRNQSYNQHHPSIQHNNNHNLHNHHPSNYNQSNNCSYCSNNNQNYSKQLLDSNYTYNQLMLQSTTPSLRSSSAGSTSSSPSTPLPSQSSDHSISSSSGSNHPLPSNGDPDTTLRLLMHIEQLKIFIPQVTTLFESIIELYRDSVETN